MFSDIPRELTVGEIARQLRVPEHRVRHILRSRRITPAVCAGNAYIYTAADVQHIASELARIERDRQGGVL